MKNFAFIDGQNLYMGTTKSENSWEIDLIRFRVYLNRKFNVTKAYYFLGFIRNENHDLYQKIREAGFTIIFREHSSAMHGKKKGNVDSDIIFNIMKKMYLKTNFDKIVLVSGDGDYKKMVDFLINENKFEKILFPNIKYSSSLYKKISRRYFMHLEDKDLKFKIGRM